MKRHLLGAILFSLIIGSAIFVTYYFIVLPKRSEVTVPQAEAPRSEIVQVEKTSSTPSKLKMMNISFFSPSQKFHVDFDCRNTNPDKPYKEGDWGLRSASSKCLSENKVLHFFVVNRGQAQYLFSKEIRTELADTGGKAFTYSAEIEPLLKLKPFRDIYVNAVYQSDYKPGSIPSFVSESAKPITSIN